MRPKSEILRLERVQRAPTKFDPEDEIPKLKRGVALHATKNEIPKFDPKDVILKLERGVALHATKSEIPKLGRVQRAPTKLG